MEISLNNMGHDANLNSIYVGDDCMPKKDHCDPCAKPVKKAESDPCAKPDPCDPCDPCNNYGWGHGFWSFFIIFIVVALIVALILWAANPDFIRKRDSAGNVTNDIDVGKLILWSVVIGLIVAFIIWLIWSCAC